MCTKGSRSARDTPAKARRTGKPSPSNPRGAVVTEVARRSWVVAGSGSGTRGRTRTSSTVMAGMSAPTSLRSQLFRQRPEGRAHRLPGLVGGPDHVGAVLHRERVDA